MKYSLLKHVKEKYPSRSTECYKFEKTGHFACPYKNTKNVRELKTENVDDDDE